MVAPCGGSGSFGAPPPGTLSSSGTQSLSADRGPRSGNFLGISPAQPTSSGAFGNQTPLDFLARFLSGGI